MTPTSARASTSELIGISLELTHQSTLAAASGMVLVSHASLKRLVNSRELPPDD